MLTSVPSSGDDLALIEMPSFSQSFRLMYSPIPVDFPLSLPFVPVKPFSNILGSFVF